jgi:hypothetical protein
LRRYNAKTLRHHAIETAQKQNGEALQRQNIAAARHHAVEML